MNTSKIGFFSRLWLAITDFRLYPFILKEKALRAFSYFFKLILICSLLLTVYFTTLFMEYLESGIKDFEEHVPDVSIENGILYASGDVEKEINSNITLIVKDEYAQDVKVSGLRENRIYIIAAKDKLLTMMRGMDITDALELEYSKIGDVNKEFLLKEANNINDTFSGKLGTALGVFVLVFFYMVISKLWMLVMYCIVVFIFNSLFILKIRFKDFIKIAIYISSLPIILEAFAITIGGNYNSTADFISFLIASVYAFYALRAITLDSVYNQTPGATPEEKIINAIRNAQDELEKQLEDLKEQEEQQKREIEEQKEKEEKSAEEEEENKEEDNGEK